MPASSLRGQYNDTQTESINAPVVVQTEVVHVNRTMGASHVAEKKAFMQLFITS